MEVDGGVSIVVQFFEIFPTTLIVTSMIMRRLGDAIGIRCGLSNWDAWLFYYILRGTRDVWASVGGFSMSCVFFLGTIHPQSQVILLGMDECQLLIGIGYRGKHLSHDYGPTCMRW